MAMPAYNDWLDQFEQGHAARGHASELEAIPHPAVSPSMTSPAAVLHVRDAEQQGHVAGEVKLSATQVRSAEILLRKCLPDLVAAEVVGETVHRFAVVPAVMSKADWLLSRGQPEVLAQLKAACRIS
jgi:hypothetical protein